MSSSQLLNAEEIARYLNLGKNTVYELAKAGKIGCYHIGRKLRFTIEDADAYLASTRGETSPVAKAAAPAPVVVEGPAAENGTELADAAAFDAPAGASFVIAGADRAADVLAGALGAEGFAVKRLIRGGYTALVNLYAGEADAAVIDLFDQASNAWNVPYVRNLAPGASVVVFRLLSRQMGLIVPAGNPARLRSWGGLLKEGVRLANRTKGSGARVLLDEKFRAMDARAEQVEGYGENAFAGAEAARRVAKGMADVTVGHAGDVAAGKDVGIDGRPVQAEFVPLQVGWVDLVVHKTPETRAAIKKLKSLLASEVLRNQLASLPGVDAERAGIIIYES